ncbi:uncharacterized protein TNCV_2635991 [Trichonephila clavipes]|nr:uncharacterized protein TNCV_2635991 [Trichonephila clavipes]
MVQRLYAFRGTSRLASREPSGCHEPPEDPPCDASIESSSHWCGALQHCVERILGRDNVRSSDLIKLIGILHKISDPKTVYEFFAIDDYQGDDPKKYVELFRYDAEDVRGKHVRAVRLLYRDEVVIPPKSVDPFWKAFSMEHARTNTEYKDMYVEHVCGQLTNMAEWRQQTKKKRPAEEDARDAKKVATED